MGYFFRSIFVYSAILFCMACQKVEIQKSASNRPILQSFLVPGQKVSLTVHKEFIFGEDDSLEKINNLIITLTSDDENETMSFIGSGQYTSEKIQVAANKTYQLSFRFNGKSISASTSIPSKPSGLKITPASLLVSTSTSTNLKLNWENNENDYYYVQIKNTEKNPIPITNQQTDKPMESLITQGHSEEIKAKNFSYLGAHQLILYHILPDYALYYKDYSINSNNVKQPPSNITNGLGIFTGINADTLSIQVVE